MQTKTVKTYEAKLYIGSKEQYDGPMFFRSDIIKAVQEYGKRVGVKPVRVTPTCYIADNYQEQGFEIVIINYPRHPHTEVDLEKFMLEMAAEFLEKFHQNRISVVLPDITVMVEADDASEKTHH